MPTKPQIVSTLNLSLFQKGFPGSPLSWSIQKTVHEISSLEQEASKADVFTSGMFSSVDKLLLHMRIHITSQVTISDNQNNGVICLVELGQTGRGRETTMQFQVALLSLLYLCYSQHGLANQPSLTQRGLHWIHGGGWLERSRQCSHNTSDITLIS